MQPAKQEALESIGKLPEHADMDEIMYCLYVLDKVRKGQKAAREGLASTSKDAGTTPGDPYRPVRLTHSTGPKSASADFYVLPENQTFSRCCRSPPGPCS